MSMPGKQARVLCPVCQEPIPPDHTECWNCGAFVIDEAVVRLSRAFGLDREKALKLFEAGFRHPKQLKDRDPDRVLAKGELGILFICTSCGGFVATGDTKCPRCGVEFEPEPEDWVPEEEDILDIALCPVCGADNDPDLVECEICGETLKETPEPERIATQATANAAPVADAARTENELEKVDDFLRDTEIQKSGGPGPAVARDETPPSVPTPPASPPRVTPPAPKAFSTMSPKPIASPAQARPEPAPTPRPLRLAPERPRAAAPRPSVPPLELERKPAPIARVEGFAAPASPEKRLRLPLPRRIPRKRVPPGSRGPVRIPPETAGGLVLAAGASLLLAGALDQLVVSAGIAAFLLGFGTYMASEYVRSGGGRPSGLDSAFLATGAVLGLIGPLLRGAPVDATAAVALAVAGAFPFAVATRRLLRSRQRILLALGSAVPMIGQGLAPASDPTYAMTLPWLVGILAAMPWPAALAATEILRRKLATIIRRQLDRAERDVLRKDYERSLVSYDRAIAAAHAGVPGAEIPWYGKGATLVLLGRYEEALRAIDTALDINPHNEVAWVNKGNALTKLGRLEDALRCLSAAIRVSPSYEVAWNNKGNALARLGKFEEAIECYERALEIDPGYRGAWVNMGYVLTKLGRYDEAASCADRALHLDPSRRADPI